MLLATQLLSETQWLFTEFNDFSVLLQLIHRHEVEVLHNLKTKSHYSVTETHGLLHIHSFWLIAQALHPNKHMSRNPNKLTSCNLKPSMTIRYAVVNSRQTPPHSLLPNERSLLILYCNEHTTRIFPLQSVRHVTFFPPDHTARLLIEGEGVIHYLAFSLGH